MMRKFAYNLIAFALPLILLFCVVSGIWYSVLHKQVNEKFSELSGYECLLMGDSQIQRMKEDEFGVHTKNIASSGEHYFFTYQKLKAILGNERHRVRTVVLGVSVHNFAPVYNQLLDLNYPGGKNSLKRYLYFLQPFKQSEFFRFDQLPLNELIEAIYSQPDWGGMLESEEADPSPEVIQKAVDQHFTRKPTEDKYCRSQITYLTKIDSLCRAHGIELIFISTPYHPEYKRKLDPGYVRFFADAMRPFKSIQHIDFSSDTVSTSFMADANHLNKKGARYYSELISRRIGVNKDSPAIR